MYFTSPFWIYIPSGFLITCPFKLYIISDPKDPFIISIICELPHGSFVSQSMYSTTKNSTYSVSINVSVINTGTSTYTVSHGSTGGSQFIGRVGSAPFSSPASTQSSHPSFNQAVCTHPNGAY